VILQLRGGPQGPIGVEQVGACQAAQVGPAGGDNRVYMVCLENIAHRHGGYAGVIAHRIGKGRLEHAPVDGFALQ